MISLCFHAVFFQGGKVGNQNWWSRKALWIKVKWKPKTAISSSKACLGLRSRGALIRLVPLYVNSFPSFPPPSHLLSSLVRSFEGGREGTSSRKEWDSVGNLRGESHCHVADSFAVNAWDVSEQDEFYLFNRERRGVFDERWPCSLTYCGLSGSWRNPWKRGGDLREEQKSSVLVYCQEESC